MLPSWASLTLVTGSKGQLGSELQRTAGKDIEYQVIIHILDAIQKYTDDEGNIQPLFPQVNFGQVVI